MKARTRLDRRVGAAALVTAAVAPAGAVAARVAATAALAGTRVAVGVGEASLTAGPGFENLARLLPG